VQRARVDRGAGNDVQRDGKPPTRVRGPARRPTPDEDSSCIRAASCREIDYDRKNTTQLGAHQSSYEPIETGALCPFPFPLPDLAFAGTAATNSAMTTASDAKSALSDRTAIKPHLLRGLEDSGNWCRGGRRSSTYPTDPAPSVEVARGNLVRRFPWVRDLTHLCIGVALGFLNERGSRTL